MKNLPTEEFIPCEDCPDPNMCATHCRNQDSLKEDTTKVHKDLPKTFWEDH